MTDPSPEDVTVLLADLSAGVPGAANRLVAVVMDELHRIADQAMRREVDGHTLQPTELVDEAMMRLLGQRQVEWVSRSQFFAVASQTIRRILVDHARDVRVGIYPVSPLYQPHCISTRRDRAGLVIGYAALAPFQIEKGVLLLAEAVEALLTFLRETYVAAAETGQRDRAALECQIGYPGKPRPLQYLL